MSGDGMTSPEPQVDPAIEAWVDRQMTHFKAGDMDGFIRQMRAFERGNRERAAREAAA